MNLNTFKWREILKILYDYPLHIWGIDIPEKDLV